MAFHNPITRLHPASLVPGDCAAELWKTLMKTLSRRHIHDGNISTVASNGNFTLLNNSIVRYIIYRIYKLFDNNNGMTDSASNWFFSCRTIYDDDLCLFASREKCFMFIFPLHSPRRWRFRRTNDKGNKREGKMHCAYVHTTCILHIVYLKRSVRYMCGNVTRARKSTFRYSLASVDRTRSNLFK